ncbi:hypothetical protein IC582_018501 [Cucumis melo]
MSWTWTTPQLSRKHKSLLARILLIQSLKIWIEQAKICKTKFQNWPGSERGFLQYEC